MRAIIIGGGIGGLSAAIALRNAGIDSDVYEQAPEPKEIGAGLSLWANGVMALRALGLGDALSAITTPVNVTGTRRATNSRLDLVDLRPVHQQLGATSVAMHRGDLLRILIGACEPAIIRSNKQVVHVEQTPAFVTAQFSDGTSASADILIAADGTASVVRKQLAGSALTYAGYSTYRSVVNDFDPGAKWPRHAIIRTLSCGEYFGIGEIATRRYLWFLTNNRPLEDPEPAERKRALMDLVASWSPPIPAIVEATSEERILLHPVYKMRPLKTWRFGRIVLLGDAAHPIEPALGMGAALAIEDAVVLGQALVEHQDHGRAFGKYEEQRMRRVGKLVRWSAVLARSEQSANPLICRVRDISTRVIPEAVTSHWAKRALEFTPI